MVEDILMAVTTVFVVMVRGVKFRVNRKRVIESVTEALLENDFLVLSIRVKYLLLQKTRKSRLQYSRIFSNALGLRTICLEPTSE